MPGRGSKKWGAQRGRPSSPWLLPDSCCFPVGINPAPHAAPMWMLAGRRAADSVRGDRIGSADAQGICRWSHSRGQAGGLPVAQLRDRWVNSTGVKPIRGIAPPVAAARARWPASRNWASNPSPTWTAACQPGSGRANRRSGDAVGTAAGSPLVRVKSRFGAG